MDSPTHTTGNRQSSAEQHHPGANHFPGDIIRHGTWYSRRSVLLANEPGFKRSFIGYLLKWGPNVFAWRVSVPKAVAPSTRDAEYMGAIKGARTLIAFSFILRELGLHPGEPLPLLTDSSSTVMSTENEYVHSDSRWMGIRLNWLRQGQVDRLFKVTWCAGDSMLADILTKVLKRIRFLELRPKVMNSDA